MNWPGRLVQASFVRRDNRFRAWVEHDGELISTHVANSGRLGELLTPGAAVWIRRHDRGSERKTASDLVLVAYAGVLVSIDARLPNKLLAEALATHTVPQLAGYGSVTPEVTIGSSRLDFLLNDGSGSQQRQALLGGDQIGDAGGGRNGAVSRRANRARSAPSARADDAAPAARRPRGGGFRHPAAGRDGVCTTPHG